MAKRFRCLKCSKIIECEPYDMEILLSHIRTDHPDIDLADDNTLMGHQSKKEKPSSVNDKKPFSEETISATVDQRLPDLDIHIERTTIRSPELRPIYTRKYKVRTPLTPRSPQKRRMYKTSIEKWRPAKGIIYCPKCGATKKPIIKSKSEKLSYSTAGAACILTCWPLCFLPCLFPAPTRDYLHCAECFNFLGMYDKQRNCVRPNRDYVEDGGCQKQTFENLIESNRQERESRVHSQ